MLLTNLVKRRPTGKLEDRVHQGVGHPFPLVLIGLPDSIVTFHEGKTALAEVEGDEDAAEGKAR